ncbi:uncharacterized protein LOC113359741 [Papaver somniferum]|uniref:uncharacterized protein LOC113359741 n=1 Tax=Papaver somniferum TaxID=3469 RepID=UPI000E704AE3|nr:uncharacterized protein LOC113359741 [Papaver somniferum]
MILEPMPLSMLPSEPDITDEEFEKEVDLMMMDSYPMEAVPLDAHDLVSIRNQWNYLKQLSESDNKPWLLVGDFNFILNVSEKQGGIPENSLASDFVRNTLSLLNMHDVFSFGNLFTWCNRRFKNPSELIFEKLDRGFINDKWVSLLPQTRVTNLGRLYSDHCPILLQCFHQVNILAIPFKYFKFWQSSPDFKDVLLHSWEKDCRGSPSFVITGKIKNLKHDLSRRNTNNFGHIKTPIGKLNSEIEKLQNMAYTPSIGSYILNYSEQLDYWYDLENFFYKQKSKIDYFTHYDKNTNYFHNFVKLRNMYNTIHTLKDNQGNWLENRDQVMSLLIDHFKKIYSTSMPCTSDIDDVLRDIKPIITYDLNISLVAIPTIEEIHSTLKCMEPWKSLGLDGFPGGFFRDNWDQVSTEVINHVQAFFINKFLLKQLNHSFIALIPKDWCQLIYQCISTVSYSILVNSSPGEMFFPTMGIRQGDCLSPYIFIICMEVLSQLLIKGENENVIQGFKLRKNSPPISHLCFADDCMLFSKASLTYARNLMKIINKFAKASVQAINPEKYVFFTSKNMHHKHIKMLSKTLGIKFLSSTEKYLGTPLFVDRDKTKTFNFLIEKFYSRLSNTKKTNLNGACRTVVTKHEFLVVEEKFKKRSLLSLLGDIKSKLNGGLGIKNSYATNIVLIAKLGWRICKNPTHLVAIFLKDKYFPNQNLLEIDKAAETSSWIWKGIVNSLAFLKANFVYKINDGKST